MVTAKTTAYIKFRFLTPQRSFRNVSRRRLSDDPREIFLQRKILIEPIKVDKVERETKSAFFLK